MLSDYSDDFEVGEELEELTEEGRRYSMAVAKYLQAEQVRCWVPAMHVVLGSCSPRHLKRGTRATGYCA